MLDFMFVSETFGLLSYKNNKLTDKYPFKQPYILKKRPKEAPGNSRG